ncbi:ATP-grasp domain-containing protein [Pseudoflavonifractor sp. 60]|uniref:carboxylate--amine ligase n=1 Tax=Pseudoflavonifractor sp. 60 TaxID=2304576 RepID=UPI001368C845|nr:ATP-grasp domain-containing protein [Pseudoflavonifractor sp. 60]NBI68754.1 ATP-grasp domain-containing protein [Pseudoflavonifractor sp. 60]
MSLPFQPLVFGGDINVYSVARAFHEAYGVRTIAYGMYPSFPCYNSAILDYRVCPNNEDMDVFRKNAQAVAAEFPDKKVILLGCGDNYVQMAAHCRDSLPENVIAPYIDGALLDTLINKEEFYKLCDQYGIDHPATFIYDKSMGHNFTLPWGPPYIAKPAESVTYWATGDRTLAKVYICQSWEELLQSLDHVYAAGYENHMILQEFIPGDDSYMRVLTSYSDHNARVTTMCLGHVLLEEHSPHGIGNHAVILTEQNEELCRKIKGLLEALHFVGFSNFDIKYDRRDGRYKAFEINCRQGRSNYYVTGAGHNIAKLLVEDLVEGKELPFQMTKNRSLWRMVPKGVAFKFTPKQYHQEMRALIKAGADHHSLVYAGDASLRRRLRVMKNHLGNIKRFDQYNTVPNEE